MVMTSPPAGYSAGPGQCIYADSGTAADVTIVVNECGSRFVVYRIVDSTICADFQNSTAAEAFANAMLVSGANTTFAKTGGGNMQWNSQQGGSPPAN